MEDHWLSLAYQYIVGGIFFVVVLMITLKTKALSLSSREDRHTLFMLVGGFILFFCVHFSWIYFVVKN